MKRECDIQNYEEHLLPWMTNHEQIQKLVIIQEPPTEFFKDKGGKYKCMRVIVRLVPNEGWKSRNQHLGESRTISNQDIVMKLPLRITVVYEDGKEVEDQSKILECKDTPASLSLIHVEQTDKYYFEGQIDFRLSQVSYKHNGQKFKLKISLPNSETDLRTLFLNQVVQQELGDASDEDHFSKLKIWFQEKVLSCCTQGILVKSKTKSQLSARPCDSGSDVTQPMPGNKRARLSRATSSTSSTSSASSDTVSSEIESTLKMLVERSTETAKVMSEIKSGMNNIEKRLESILTMVHELDMIRGGNDLRNGVMQGVQNLIHFKNKNQIDKTTPFSDVQFPPVQMAARLPSWGKVHPTDPQDPQVNPHAVDFDTLPRGITCEDQQN